MAPAPDPRHPARSPLTWALALLCVLALDAAVTRTSWLWGPTAFENSGGLRTVFPQTYQAARALYAPGPAARDADLRVALLGNSRIVLAVQDEASLEAALAARRPGLDAHVANLGVFGSFMGDTAMLARHLDAFEPGLVVLTIGGEDLLRAPSNPRGRGALRLLAVGFADVEPAEGWGARLDRWARTVFRLYRFREFAREALLDRVLGRPDPGPAPKRFPTRLALFQHLYGERAVGVHAAYEAWQREPSLARYVAYLERATPEHLGRDRERARQTTPLGADAPAVRVLDRLVAELGEAGHPTLILLMPENPLLAEDTAGALHRPEISDQAAALVAEVAARHGVPMADARAWLPAGSFLDFDHPIFELGDFDRRLAQEILDALPE